MKQDVLFDPDMYVSSCRKLDCLLCQRYFYAIGENFSEFNYKRIVESEVE